MNFLESHQQFAVIVTGVMGTYFATLILAYVLRTSLAWILSENSDYSRLRAISPRQFEEKTQVNGEVPITNYLQSRSANYG